MCEHLDMHVYTHAPSPPPSAAAGLEWSSWLQLSRKNLSVRFGPGMKIKFTQLKVWVKLANHNWWLQRRPKRWQGCPPIRHGPPAHQSLHQHTASLPPGRKRTRKQVQSFCCRKSHLLAHQMEPYLILPKAHRWGRHTRTDIQLYIHSDQRLPLCISST